MGPLHLQRPLAVFDIESTGTNPRVDRIIDLAIVRLMPDGGRTQHTFRVDPEIPIPAETTAVHGIHDADVVGAPTFKDIAPEVKDTLDGCDLAGYNAIRFDIPMLVAEFKRAELAFSIDDRFLIDPQRIYHQREPRDLGAALQFYCSELHLGAHGALDDVLATVRVLEGQYARYTDLPESMEELHTYCNPRNAQWVDREGRLKWSNGEVAINFGRNQGRTIRSLVKEEMGFLNWMLQKDFPDDAKDIIRSAIQGNYPSPPAS